jgi:alpha/beta superfamily hydrolase
MQQTVDFPTEKKSLALQGAAGQIELAITVPNSLPVNKVIVICHPHPLYGGTMDNKVITTLMRTFDGLGYATVRFNFRGVGHSEGEHDKGIGEALDLISILDWVSASLPDASISLAGFSFGSYVAYRVATTSDYRERLAQLILIAPPVQYPEFADLPEPNMPWLVVQGEADEVVDASAVFTWLAQFSHKPRIIRMPETSHFFHGKLVDLKQHIISALTV